MRNVSFRAYATRNGARRCELKFEADAPPAVYMDYAAEIKLSMQGEFFHDAAVDYINDEISPVAIVDGVEHPLGVYHIVTRREVHGVSNIVRDEIEAYDRGVLLTWAKLERRAFWPAGTPYLQIVSELMTQAGIKLATITPSTLALQSDREDWDIGTSYMSIINTLLGEINYFPIWFDLNGIAHVEPYVAPSARIINHQYGKQDAIKVLMPGAQSEIDLYAKPNVFVAILENPEYETPLVKYAVNDTPGSKLSTISRGIRIPAVYHVDNIASEEELQAYANKLRDESMQTSEYVNITTAFLPGHNPGDVIALNHPAIQGIFREVGWAATLRAGQEMNHRLQRVVIL